MRLDLPTLGRPMTATVMRVIILRPRSLKVEVSADGVQQVAGAVAVHAGDGDQLAEAQAVEIVQLHRRLADLIALVDSQQQRACRCASACRQRPDPAR